MTHSLHRQGSVESLKNDFVIFAYSSKGINMAGAPPKLRRIAEVVFDAGPVNAGTSRRNKSIANGLWDKETAMADQEDARSFICCFDDREKVKQVLSTLRDEELGISVVVSGLIDQVMEMAAELQLNPHTINLSAGVLGKKDLLPEAPVIDFTTMCGHSLIPNDLVRKAIDEVRAGTKTPEEAAVMAAVPCNCGIVNIARAARLLSANS